MGIADSSKVETKQIKELDVTLRLGLLTDDDGNVSPAYMFDEPYKNMHIA